jgi:glutaredoxin
MKDIIVYTKDGCPYCEKIKQFFNYLKTPYEVKNLNENFTKEEFYDMFGEGSTFPQVIIDNEKRGGCVDTIKYLKSENII